MKKFFEKYDLIKVSGILVLASAILTWLVPTGYFSGSEMVVDEITRVGFADLCQYGLLGIYYFTVLVTFLLVLGGFYQVLSKRAGFQKLVKNIGEKLKGREIPAVLITMLIFAILGSLVTEYFPLIAFIPFIIAIFSYAKVDKISSFVATFGGLLVGTIGSTYSPKVVGQLTGTSGFSGAEDYLVIQAILFVISYLLLAAFTVLRMKKQKKNTKKNESYDRFELASVNSEEVAPKTWPYIIGIVLFIIVTVLAYLPWETWEVTIFADATEWVNKLAIFKVPIFSYIFTEFQAFGTWDIFQIQFVMIFITLLIHWFGKMTLSELLESYGEGFKKMGNTTIVLLFVYFVLIVNVMSPTIPVIVEWLANVKDGFNVLFASASALLASITGVEMQYVMSLAGSYYASTFQSAHSTLVVIYQCIWGLVSFFIPSSAILMIGLSYNGIPYKDWMKFIWKFLLIMLAVIVVIIIIVA